MNFNRFARFLFIFILPFILAETSSAQNFKIVPLGVKGGGDESNLSSYAVSANGSNDWVCLDAGTLYSGIRAGFENGSFKGDSSEFLTRTSKAILSPIRILIISQGLLLNAADDSAKPIYGLPYTLDVMTEVYFSWKGWVNWSDKGELPRLGKYAMTALEPKKETPVVNTSLFVTAYALSHTPNSQSTAFFVRSADNYLLYLGDTGSDETEHSTRLTELWEAIAPVIKEKKLRGLFIETSYVNSQQDKFLFGHFTPAWLMKELGKLEALNGKGSLNELNVVITHLKPSGNNEEIIKNQLRQLNTFKLHLIFPEQGKSIEL